MEKARTPEDLIHGVRFEHRQLRDLLVQLKGSLASIEIGRSRGLLEEINRLAGPHVRFEEEFLYPTLKRFVGDYINRFYRENDALIETVRALFSLFEEESLPYQVAEDSTDHVVALLLYLCNSEGLSLMCELVDTGDLEGLLAGRQLCIDEMVPLVEWADSIRDVSKAV